MELPDIDSSSDVYVKHTDHFTGAVEGWSDAETITDPQRQSIAEAGNLVSIAATALKNSVAARQTATRDATQLRARFRIRDIILDQRVMSASDGVLNGPAMRDRKHPTYRVVFQDGTAGDITQAKRRTEPDAVARMLQRFANIEDFDGKQRIRMNVEQALQKSIATREALDAAEISEHHAGDMELQGRLGVRIALEKAHGLLRSAFPGQRNLVESFFFRPSKQKKKKKPIP